MIFMSHSIYQCDNKNRLLARTIILNFDDMNHADADYNDDDFFHLIASIRYSNTMFFKQNTELIKS